MGPALLKPGAAGRRRGGTGDDGVGFGELLVAAIIAAFGDGFARDVELLSRFRLEGQRGLEFAQDCW